MMGEWMGDTPQTVMSTRAPALLSKFPDMLFTGGGAQQDGSLGGDACHNTKRSGHHGHHLLGHHGIYHNDATKQILILRDHVT